MIAYGNGYNHAIEIDNAESFISRLPFSESQPLFAFSTMRDNAINFVEYFCEAFQRSGVEFEETLFCTYNINQAAAEIFEHYKKQNILSGKTYILFNNIMLHQKDDRSRFVIEALDAAPGLEWRTANVHAKLQLYKSGKHHFIVEGSGNMAENSNLEFYTIHYNQQLYNFRRSVIMQFFGNRQEYNESAIVSFGHIGGK